MSLDLEVQPRNSCVVFCWDMFGLCFGWVLAGLSESVLGRSVSIGEGYVYKDWPE